MTIWAARMLSQVRPCCRIDSPIPPPSAKPIPGTTQLPPHNRYVDITLRLPPAHLILSYADGNVAPFSPCLAMLDEHRLFTQTTGLRTLNTRLFTLTTRLFTLTTHLFTLTTCLLNP